MVEVVYNECYGGFGLSKEAKARYKELGGTYDFKNGDWNIDRTDPILVSLVKEGKASSTLANLKIADISSGTKYRIDEYDGSEAVMTVDDYEWIVAN